MHVRRDDLPDHDMADCIESSTESVQVRTIICLHPLRRAMAHYIPVRNFCEPRNRRRGIVRPITSSPPNLRSQ